MTIFGVDIHPQYQAGINIEEVRHEGFDFMACKVSEGTDPYDSIDWLGRGETCGLLSCGYHFLRPGNEDAQAQTFVNQLTRAGGAPGMLDAEAVDQYGQATLTGDGIKLFLERAAAHGAHVPLLYLPRWYWLRIGSPDLTGTPVTLWASSYPTSGPGIASVLYEAVGAYRWASYAGLPVSVLQFTDAGQVAGYQVDCDAFIGDRAGLESLLSGKAAPPTPPTPAPRPSPVPDWTSLPSLQYGDRSDAVTRLQTFMTTNFQAYNRYTPTGYYGDSTAAGLAEFQRRVGITTGDGRNVGPLTKQALWRYGWRG